MASLTIFWEVSWMPNPIREAFLLNSDLEEGGVGGFGEATEFSAWLTVVVPIFFRVWDRDRNSAVRSLQEDAIGQMVSDPTVEVGNLLSDKYKVYCKIPLVGADRTLDLKYVTRLFIGKKNCF